MKKKNQNYQLKSTRKKDKFKLGIRIPNTAFQLSELKPIEKCKFEKRELNMFIK